MDVVCTHSGVLCAGLMLLRENKQFCLGYALRDCGIHVQYRMSIFCSSCLCNGRSISASGVHSCHVKFVYFFWLTEFSVELAGAAPFDISFSMVVFPIAKDVVQLVNSALQKCLSMLMPSVATSCSFP